jgi:aldehyde dehydrogenase (NAD+)
MELGGKSPFIVFEDADLDSAVEGVVDAIWFNQGQVCCAGSRLLIQESVEKLFIKKLKARMEKLRVGNPLDKSIDIGAIVAPVQLKKIQSIVKKGEKEGSKLWQPSWACPTDGLFYPPSIFTNVSPSSFIAQVEIFGPVLSILSFRTPSEAVSIANNTQYGLAASVWSENINLALDIAPKIKAGVIWINSTNLFDASCGFGGYKESGFGREGGFEGIRSYQERFLPESNNNSKKIVKNKIELPSIDTTPKLYVGGKQKRPDSGYSFNQLSAQKEFICDIASANRKDVRDTVEAASKSKAGSLNNFNRSQILFYLAENLSQRKETFINLLMSISGINKNQAVKEFDQSCERIFYYASMADKFEGSIHNPPMRGLTLAVKEPIGIIASIMNDDQPLLSLSTIISSLFANGNSSIIVPSEKSSLIATSLYQVFETSDIPPGSINILTAKQNELNETLSKHENIHGIWTFSNNAKVRSSIIHNTVFNLKRFWCPKNNNIDWSDNSEEFLNEFLYEGSQIKNIWIPYGE